FFGVPLQLGFALLGAPFTALNGLATGATLFGNAAVSGDVLAALTAVANTPAYVVDGFLNGTLTLDLPLPVTVPVGGVPVNLMTTAHVPLGGVLVGPQSTTVTVPAVPGLIPVSINATLGGTQFAGLVPELTSVIPLQIAQ